MKRVAARLSRRGSKAKPQSNTQTWQGEHFSALDHEAFFASLELNKQQQQHSLSAKTRKNSPQLRERGYVREMVVVSDDMLTGSTAVLHSSADLPDSEMPSMLAEAKASGMRFRSPSFSADDAFPSPIEEDPCSEEEEPEISAFFADSQAGSEITSRPSVRTDDKRTDINTLDQIGREEQFLANHSDQRNRARSSQLAALDASAANRKEESFLSTVDSLQEDQVRLEKELADMKLQVAELEDANSQLRTEVSDMNSERANAAAASAAADSAIAKWRDLEEEHRQLVPMLQAKLAASERRCETGKRQNEQLALQLSHANKNCSSLKQKLKSLNESLPPVNTSSTDTADQVELLQEEVAQLQEKEKQLQVTIKEMQLAADAALKEAQEEKVAAEARARQEEVEKKEHNEDCVRLRQQNQRLLSERHSLRLANQKLEQQLANDDKDEHLSGLLSFISSHLPAADVGSGVASTELEQRLLVARSQVLAAESCWQQTQLLSKSVAALESQMTEKQVLLDAEKDLLCLEKAKNEELQKVAVDLRHSLTAAEERESSFEVRIDSLRNEVQEREHDIRRLHEDKEAAENHVKKLESEQSKLAAQSDPELAAAALQAAKTQNTQLLQERAQLRMKHRQLQASEKEARAQLKTVLAGKGSLQTELEVTKQRVSELVEKTESLSAAIAEQRESFSAELSQEKQQLNSYREQLAAQMNDVTDAVAARTSSEQRLAVTLANLDNAQEQLQSVQRENSKLLLNQQQLQEQLEQAKSAAVTTANAKSRVSALEADRHFAELESQRAHLAKENNSLRGKVSELEGDLSRMATELEAMQQGTVVAALQQRKADLEAIVAELKQQNEQLYAKLQQEKKNLTEAEDCKQTLENQLRERDAELRSSREENERIQKGIDELESMPDMIKQLTEENQWLKSQCLPSMEEQQELDQENQHMEWRLLQMERGLAERDRLREENRRLEKTRRQHLVNEQQFEEMKEELLRLQLHNHQIPVLQDQCKSKHKEVRMLEQENRQLQRELREVELEVAVLKQKSNKLQAERERWLEERQAWQRQQQLHHAGVSQEQATLLQVRITEMEEEYSRLMERMEKSLQRQQQMAEELKEMSALKELVLEMEEENSRLQEKGKVDVQQLDHLKSTMSKQRNELANAHLQIKSLQPSGQNYESPVIENGGIDEADILSFVNDENSDYQGLVDDEVAEACKTVQLVLNVDVKQLSTDERKHEELLKKTWFALSKSKETKVEDLRDLLRYVAHQSPQLLHHIVNYVDGNGNTALHYLLSYGQLSAAALLLNSRQCRVNARNAGGYTPTMLAAASKNLPLNHHHVLRKLFHQADIDALATADGRSALMLAVCQGNGRVVELLLEADCDVNLQDMDGSTALMCACEHSQIDMVRLLLGSGRCNVNVKDNDGSSALQIAMEKKDQDIAVLLYASVVCTSPKTKLKRQS